MSISAEEKIVLDILNEEKKLLIQGQLQLIQTSKQTIAFIIPLLGLALDVASRFPAIYLLIPFLICAFVFFFLSNQNTFNINCEYSDRLDREIVKRAHMDFPLFQMSVGNTMADWKFNMSSGFGYFIPQPYYLLGIAVAVVILPVYIFSIVRGDSFLCENHFYWFNVGFDIFSVIGLTTILYTGIVYPKKFLDFRRRSITKSFNDLMDESQITIA